MTKYTQEDIDKLLEEWFRIKTKLTELEHRRERCKLLAEKIMRHENTDKLENANYKVERRLGHRTSITKANVPPEVWSKYAETATTTSYYISESRLGQSGESRSPEKKSSTPRVKN